MLQRGSVTELRCWKGLVLCHGSHGFTRCHFLFYLVTCGGVFAFVTGEHTCNAVATAFLLQLQPRQREVSALWLWLLFALFSSCVLERRLAADWWHIADRIAYGLQTKTGWSVEPRSWTLVVDQSLSRKSFTFMLVPHGLQPDCDASSRATRSCRGADFYSVCDAVACVSQPPWNILIEGWVFNSSRCEWFMLCSFSRIAAHEAEPTSIRHGLVTSPISVSAVFNGVTVFSLDNCSPLLD